MPGRVKLLVGVALAAVVLGAVTLVSTGSSELSSNQWRLESEFPEAPSAEDNGWLILVAEQGSSGLDDESETLGEVSSAISNQNRSVDERWKSLADAQAGIRRMLGRSSNEAALQRWHAASAAVAFVDVCSLEIGVQCFYFAGFQLHQLAQIEIVGKALRGDWSAANAQLSAALRMDGHYLQSGRNAMAMTVATSNAEHDLGLAQLLLARQPVGAEGRDALVAAVVGVDVDSSVWTSSVIGGYVYDRHVLEWVQEHGPEEAIGDAWWPPHFLYDAEQTSEMLDAVYQEVMMKEEPKATWSAGARIFNPVGCALVDPESIHARHDSLHENLDRSLTKAQRWRREILDRWGGDTNAPSEVTP